MPVGFSLAPPVERGTSTPATVVLLPGIELPENVFHLVAFAQLLEILGLELQLLAEVGPADRAGPDAPLVDAVAHRRRPFLPIFAKGRFAWTV